MTLPRILNFTTNFSLGLLAFLTPILVLPWTTDALDFNKYILLALLGTVATLSFLGKMVALRTVEAKMSPAFLLPVLFLLLTGLSCAFSVAPYTSLLGEGGQEYVSLLTVAFLTVVFLVGANVFSEIAMRRNIVSAMLLSSGFLSIFVLLSFLHVSFGAFANTIGVPTMLTLYFLAMSVLGLGSWLATNAREREAVLPQGGFGILVRVAITLTAVASLVLLISIDSFSLWIVALVGLLPLFAFILAMPKEFTEPLKFVLPLLFLVSSLMFLFLPSVLKNPYPLEVSPKIAATAELVGKAWSEGSFLTGTGPGTFMYTYVKYMPADVNQTIFWDTRFDRGASYLLTMLATYGLLAGLVFVTMLGATVVLSLQYFSKSRVHEGWKWLYGPFSAWMVLASGAFLLSGNMAISILFALISALVISQVTPPAAQIPFAKSPRMALISAFLFMLMGVTMLVAFFVSASRYSAEIAFAKAAAKDKAGEPLDVVIPLLSEAASRNRSSDLYLRNLANTLLLKTAEVAQDQDADPNVINQYAQASVNAALTAEKLAPKTVANWEVLATVYRELSTVLPQANDNAVISALYAAELAPENPRVRVLVARAYIVRADLLRTLIEGDDEELATKAKDEQAKSLAAATEALQKALELKSDYAAASYYLAFVEERKGNLAEAVRNMEVVRATNMNDIGVGLQLSLLYLRQGKNDSAEAELKRILTIAPTYWNARWYLALLYADAGKKTEALAELEKIEQALPEDQNVKQAIERIKEGDAVTEAPLAEPLETPEAPEAPGESATTELTTQ